MYNWRRKPKLTWQPVLRQDLVLENFSYLSKMILFVWQGALNTAVFNDWHSKVDWKKLIDSPGATKISLIMKNKSIVTCGLPTAGIRVGMLSQKINISILKNVYRLFLLFKYTKTMPGITDTTLLRNKQAVCWGISHLEKSPFEYKASKIIRSLRDFLVTIVTNKHTKTKLQLVQFGHAPAVWDM